MTSPAETPDRRVQLRWLIMEGEGRSLLAAAAAHFCLLCGYYMLRSLRESLALDAGRSQFANLFSVTLLTSLLVLPCYWWMVARVPRRLLFPATYAGVIVIFLAFAWALHAKPGSPWVAAGYFITITTFNLFIVSVFWSVMADVWRSDSAKRLFGFIAAGGSLGALAGPAFNALFVERLGLPAVIVVACGMLCAAIVLGVRAQRTRSIDDAAHVVDPSIAVGGRALADLKRLLTSRYLLTLALVIVVGQIVAAFVYNEQARIVEAAFADREARAALFARIDFGVSALSLLLQLGVVGWLTARGSIKLSLSIVPALLGASYTLLALAPSAAMLLTTQVLRRAIDYGLFKPTREMLFTILNPESKFKSKSLMDTLLQRGADSAGNWLYVLVSGLGLAGIAWLSAGTCLLLVMATLWLGGVFEKGEALTQSAPSGKVGDTATRTANG